MYSCLCLFCEAIVFLVDNFRKIFGIVDKTEYWTSSEAGQQRQRDYEARKQADAEAKRSAGKPQRHC